MTTVESLYESPQHNLCISSVIITIEELVCPDLIDFSCEENLSEVFILEELEIISIDNNFSRFDFDVSILNLECQSEIEQLVSFYGQGLCSDYEPCTSIVRIISSDKVPEEAEEEIEENSNLYFPNTFSSSSSDPTNRSFTIFGNEAFHTLGNVQVYNRWGNIVWQSDFYDLK